MLKNGLFERFKSFMPLGYISNTPSLQLFINFFFILTPFLFGFILYFLYEQSKELNRIAQECSILKTKLDASEAALRLLQAERALSENASILGLQDPALSVINIKSILITVFILLFLLFGSWFAFKYIFLLMPIDLGLLNSGNAWFHWFYERVSGNTFYNIKYTTPDGDTIHISGRTLEDLTINVYIEVIDFHTNIAELIGLCSTELGSPDVEPTAEQIADIVANLVNLDLASRLV
jgi:hypothetical protein